MSILNDIMSEELERNLRKQKAYEKQLKDSPCGSVIIREINGNQYVSLTFRKDGKVINKNIGPLKKVDVNELKTNIAQAKEYKVSLKELQKEEQKLRKVLRGI